MLLAPLTLGHAAPLPLQAIVVPTVWTVAARLLQFLTAVATVITLFKMYQKMV